MKVLAIVISYNFIPWMDRCLGSLVQSDYPVDILVIDNDSTDDTIDTIKKRYPQVRLIENKKNLGFGKANNIGIQIALKEQYDSILLINQDAWIDNKSVGLLVRASLHHTEYGILSPVHLTGNHDKLEKGFSHYIRVDSLSSLPQEHIISVPFINAAIWYIPTTIIRKVGLFAPLFYHYGEDKDYANRIKYYGYRIGYIPTAFACHDREFRKISKKDYYRAEKVYLLSEYANINYSFQKAFAYSILAGIKKAIISLKKRELNNCIAYFNITFYLISQTKKVYKTRKKSYQNNIN